MVGRSEKEIRQRAPLWFASLLVINLALMSYDARDEATKQRMIRVWIQTIASPFQWATSNIGGAGIGVFQQLSNLRRAATENEQLSARVAEMETELRVARTAHDENERLKALLGLKEGGQYPVIVGHVIARDTSAWFDSVLIDRGREAGVKLNMPVVTARGIVGRIVATSPLTSQVMLITDERSGVGSIVGQLGASNAIGSVRSSGKNGLLEMRYVSGAEQVNQGDYVVTTGQDGIYPPGLNVGEVAEVHKGTATMHHTIYLKPSADIDSLEEIAILQYDPPARAALDETLPNIDKKKK